MKEGTRSVLIIGIVLCHDDLDCAHNVGLLVEVFDDWKQNRQTYRVWMSTIMASEENVKK